jgi:SAM-dependent methyltransferase
MNLARRELIPERMDDPSADAHSLGPALRFLERMNGLPGGAGLVTGLLLEEHPRWRPCEPLTLLDIGTGAADVPRAVVATLARLGHVVRAVGIDLHAGTIAYAKEACAREPAIALVRADALALPFADGAVDYALSSTFLHHLDDAQAVRCLAEMRRVARRGLIVTDLIRTRLAYAVIRVATWLGGDPVAAHDGPVSVRRAFTPDELAAHARAAGVPEPRVTRHAPFRLALVSRW